MAPILAHSSVGESTPQALVTLLIGVALVTPGCREKSSPAAVSERSSSAPGEQSFGAYFSILTVKPAARSGNLIQAILASPS